jgi:cob(I)alamin adenosyltransferase
MKIYTRTGDTGETALFGGGRVPKDADRIEAYGSVDEVNACIGVARAHVDADDRLARISDLLRGIQSDLFILGGDLATPPDARVRPPRVSSEHVTALEHAIDRFEEDLPELRNFILPAGGLAASSLHLARTVTRRAERAVVSAARQEAIAPEAIVYLNRLSDLLFVLARWCAYRCEIGDDVWQGLS